MSVLQPVKDRGQLTIVPDYTTVLYSSFFVPLCPWSVKKIHHVAGHSSQKRSLGC